MPDDPPDRYHNREEDSPESLRRSIDGLAEAVAALDRKLDDALLGLGADIDGARAITRNLAGDVALMGEALVRRIEQSAPNNPIPVAVSVRRRRSNVGGWIAGLVLLLFAAATAVVLLTRAGPRDSVAAAVSVPAVSKPLAPPAPAPATHPAAPSGELPPTAAKPHHNVKAGYKWRTHRPWRAPVRVQPKENPADSGVATP